MTDGQSRHGLAPGLPGGGPGATTWRHPRRDGGAAPGFTITEAVVALGLTLMVAGSFGLLFRQARLTLGLQPELAVLRQDTSAVLDRITADLARAGGGLPAEIPVFTDLDRAGDRNPDGLDFLTAPEGLAETSFEPVVSFDGVEVRLGHPRSRLDRGSGDPDRRFVVIFNDDEMTPRWAFGHVVSVHGVGGESGLVEALGTAGNQVAQEPPGEASLAGATVRIDPRETPWHRHFHPSVDGDTFGPGSGGGLLERALQSVLGGAIEAVVPGIASGALASLTEEVVTAMLERFAQERGLPAGTPLEVSRRGGAGLFGLGQPGLVPVTRIRYWVRDAAPDAADPRRVLMRRRDDEPPQPVGYVEDLQVRYVTGQNSDILLDTPPRFVGDMASAARLRDHIVRAVDISVRVRAAESRADTAFSGGGAALQEGEDAYLTRVYRRRIGLRAAVAGVDRRAWEEVMQLNSLPTEIPRIGPLRFLPVPW